MGGILGAVAGGALGLATGGTGLALAGSVLSGAAKGAAVGGLLDGSGGGGGSGTNASSTSSSVNQLLMTPEQQAEYQSVLDRQKQIFNTPYQNYTGEAVAPFSQDQLNAFQGVRGMQGQYQPMMNQASAMAMQAGQAYQGGITQDQLNQFMNPYQQGVIDITKRNASTDYDAQLANLRNREAGSGTYGGSRGALMESQLTNNNARNLSDIQMTGSAANYNQALQAVMANRQGLMSSASGIGALASQGQAMGYRDLGALAAQGDQQQQQQQQQDNFNYSQFQQAQAYPQQQVNSYANLMTQLYPSQGNKVMTQNPATPSTLQQILGAGGILGSGAMGGIGNLGNSIGGLFGSESSNYALNAAGQGNQAYSNLASADSGGLFSSIGSFFGFADGGLVPGKKKFATWGPADSMGPATGAYASGGLVDYIRNVAQPSDGSRAQNVLNELGTPQWSDKQIWENELSKASGLAASALRPFATANQYLFGKGSPTLAQAWDSTGTDSGISSAPSASNSDQLLTNADPSNWEASDTDTADTLTSAARVNDNSEPSTPAKTDVNDPLLRFGIQMLTGGGKSNAVAIGKGFEAFANARELDKKQALDTARVQSEIDLQKAQIQNYQDTNKEKIQQQKDSARFDTQKITTFQKLAQSATDSGDTNAAEFYQSKINVETEPEKKNLVMAALQSKVDPTLLQQNIPPSFIGEMLRAGYLTKDQARAIKDTYYSK